MSRKYWWLDAQNCLEAQIGYAQNDDFVTAVPGSGESGHREEDGGGERADETGQSRAGDLRRPTVDRARDDE